MAERVGTGASGGRAGACHCGRKRLDFVRVPWEPGKEGGAGPSELL